MPMPEATVDKDGGFVLGEDDVGADEFGRDAALRRPDSAARCPYPRGGKEDRNGHVQTKAESQPMKH
jgi:hypothetical protein